jgi:hypothetical protein
VFAEEAVGWQLVGGEIQIRGDEAYGAALDNATDALDESEMAAAASELREAMRDLSRRPEADLSGAIHHAMMALECVVLVQRELDIWLLSLSDSSVRPSGGLS